MPSDTEKWGGVLATGDLRPIIRGWPASDETPTALIAMSDVLVETGYAEVWQLTIDGNADYSHAILGETVENLGNHGFRPDLVDCFGVLLLAELINQRHRDLFDFNAPVSKISLKLADILLAGFLGVPDNHTIVWLLDYAINCGVEEARAFKEQLLAASSGDKESRKWVVSRVLPLWHTQVDEGILIESGSFQEDLGFPFEYASEIKDNLSLMTFQADFFYQLGHAGDEDRACRLAAEAAISGSHKAWELLEKWYLSGDCDRITTCLLEIGKTRSAPSNAHPNLIE